MTPVDRLRLQKAAADCGFEMTSVPREDGVEMRSARFPEAVLVRVVGEERFEVGTSDPTILDLGSGGGRMKVDGYGDLYAVLRVAAARARTKPNRIAEEFKKKTAAMPNATEAERLVVQRVGQSLFRGALLDYWQGKCCVTGLEVPALLRASHIRPWAECANDEQRLDVFNGLLLAPHVDALFDGGWISFEDNGEMVLSPQLPQAARAQIGLSSNWRVAGLTDGHRSYLPYHRAHVMRYYQDAVAVAGGLGPTDDTGRAI